MNLVGTSRIWIERFKDIHDVILTAVVRCWPACRATCEPTTLENEITHRLVIILRRDSIVRSSPFFVESQLELLPNDLRGDVTAKGYLDIAVLFFTPGRKVYLALECKRLNVADARGGRRSLATEYVLQGMMRFVRAQYAKRFPVGAMIGYVMDGDVLSANSAITTQIIRYKHRLRSRLKDVENGTPPAALTTTHRRSCGAIRLSHLLVPFS
jgi:hypothetical protein